MIVPSSLLFCTITISPMSLNNKSSHTTQRPEEQEEAIYDDAPPAYSATADYILPPTQQQQSQQSSSSSSRISPPRVNSFPIAESSSSSIHSRKESSSGYHYNSNRGLLGNSLGYVTHELTRATSKASQKTNNDATKAVLKSVVNFFEECDRKEKKSYERDMRDRQQWERKLGNRHSLCQPPQPHQAYAAHARPRSLCIEAPRIQPPHIQAPQIQAPHIHIEQPYIHQPYIHQPYIPCTNLYKTTSCNRKQ